MRTFSTFALALTLAAAGGGQQKPTFRSTVELVPVDVNVVDRTSHAPIDDLTPADFTVSVDGKPRKVVAAQFIRYAVRSTPAAGRLVSSETGEPVIPASMAAPARNILIVIDEDSMEPGDGLVVRREAARFIDRLAPDDRIGVMTIPRMEAGVTMTKNRDQAKAVLNRIITGSERYRPIGVRIGVWEAFAAEFHADVLPGIQARECPVADEPCRRRVREEMERMQTEEHLRGERSLRALRELGVAMAGLKGPKTFLLVSGGSPRPDYKSTMWENLVGDAFVTSQITLYTLYLQQTELGQVKYRTSPSAARDHLVDREGLENMTSAAGGAFMDAIGSWDQYFDRIITELAGSYVLGIEVEAADRNGRPHRVSVTVNRKNVEVRSRKQYVINAPSS